MKNQNLVSSSVPSPWFAPFRIMVAPALIFLAVLLAAPAALAANGNWNTNSGGLWSDSANWSGGVPASAGDTASLTNDITAASIITNDVNTIVGTLNIGDLAGNAVFTLTTNDPASTFTLDNNGGGASINKRISTAADVINTPLVLNDNLFITNATTTGQLTISNAITETGGSRAIAYNGVVNTTGKLNLTAANNFSGGFTISGGQVSIFDVAALGTGPIIMNANTYLSGGNFLVGTVNNGVINWTNGLTVLGTSTNTIQLTKVNAKLVLGGQLIGNSSSTLELSSGNSPIYQFSGDFTAFEGTMRVRGNAANNPATTLYDFMNTNAVGAPLAKIVMVPSANAANYAVLEWNPVDAISAIIPIGSLTSELDISQTPANAVIRNVRADTTATFQIGGLNTSGNFGGTISDGFNGTDYAALTKVGTGTLTLSGVGTYSGPTIVSNGTLVVNCSVGAGSWLGTTPVSVVAPGVLAGNGTITGPVTLSVGNAGILLTNGAGATLTVNGDLTLDNGNTLAFDVGSPSDVIAVSGSYAQTGTATVYLAAAAGFGVGTFNLITGASGINAANFTLLNSNAIPGYTMALSNPDSSTLAVTVTGLTSATAFWHNRSGTTWNLATNWDTDASGNTALSSVPGIPTDVTFAADAASSYNTTLGADFSIHSLILSTPNNVTIGGANTLTLAAGLVNDYSAANNNLNTKAVLGVSQTWANNSGNSLVVNSNISGASSLTIASSGASIVLNAPNTYSGGTIINSGTLELGNAADTLANSGAVAVNGGTLSLGANTDTVGAVSLTNGSITASSGALTGSSYYVENGTVSANLAGAGTLTKANSGTVLLSGTNTYTGSTAVTAGILQVGSTTALGATSGITTISSGGTVDLNGQTIAENIGSGNGTVVGAGAGGVGAIMNSSGTAALVTGDVNGGNSDFTVGCTGDITLNRLTGNNGMDITKIGGGILTLAGTLDNANNRMILNEGTMILAKDPSAAGVAAIGRGLTIASGATAKLGGTGGNQIQNTFVTVNGTFDMNALSEAVGDFDGSGLITSSAGGAVTLTTATTAAGTTKTFTGTLENGSGTLSLTKGGAYTQVLGGTSTYSGDTTISAGVLRLNSASAASASSTYTVNAANGLQFATDTAFTLGGLGGSQGFVLTNAISYPVALTVGANHASTTHSGLISGSGSLTKTGNGTLTLSGNNSYSGGTIVSVGTLALNSGQTSSTGTITMDDGANLSVTVSGATQLTPSALTFGTAGAVTNTFAGVNSTTIAPVNVGTLTVNGSLKINIASGTFVVGQTYPLIAYGSEFISGSVALGSLPGGVNATLTDNGIGLIYLTVDSFTVDIWTGAVNGIWDTTFLNWQTNSTATTYVAGLPVQFDDTATGTTAITNIAAVSPASITVTNDAKNYSFSGGSIGGAGVLTKSGTGTLTLNDTNTYAGGTLVTGGTLEANVFGALGTGPLTLNGGTLSNSVSCTLSNAISLNVNSTVGVKTNGTLTLAQAITNAGSLTLGGGGTLALTGAGNTYTGGTVINDGSTLSIRSAAPINTYTINAGGTVSLDAGSSFGSGATTFNGAGTLRITNSISFGNPSGRTVALSAGGLVRVTGGASVVGSSSNRGNWASNLGLLRVDAGSSINFVEAGNASIVQCSALTGGGLVQGGFYAFPQNTVLTMGAADGSGTFDGVLADNPNAATDPKLYINKIGSGTQTLTGNNTYTGTTTVSAGTLLVNGTNSGAGAVIVNGGTLGGTGTIGGPVTVNTGGTLSPGTSPGTLALNNNLTLNADSTNVFEVNGSTLAKDLVVVGGTVTYGGVLKIVPSGSFSGGQSFTLFSGTGTTNASNFTSIEGSPGSGLSFAFTNGVLSVVVAGPSPTVLTNSYNGSVLSLSWPSGQGWRLQMQTTNRSVGLNTNWVYITDSSVSSTNITPDKTSGTVFYRLANP